MRSTPPHWLAWTSPSLEVQRPQFVVALVGVSALFLKNHTLRNLHKEVFFGMPVKYQLWGFMQQRPSKVEAIQPSGCNRWRTLLCCKRITRIDREKELLWCASR